MRRLCEDERDCRMRLRRLRKLENQAAADAEKIAVLYIELRTFAR